jgi:hypothetical protein
MLCVDAKLYLISVVLENKNIPNKRKFLNGLNISYETCLCWRRIFRKYGKKGLIPRHPGPSKRKDSEQTESAILELVHTPPMSHNVNRTTWKFEDLKRILWVENGILVSRNFIGEVLKSAGYKWCKTRTVATSNDPNYEEKLQKIKAILSGLKNTEKFFSIDEFGPFSIRKRPGLQLVRFNEYPTVPQYQKSKGFLIVTAALELSGNQVTHFYSEKKNTDEMIKLLYILLEKYSQCEKIYLSWDAASWHISKKLKAVVDEINSSNYHKEHTVPLVELTPLPSRAQFLNVIESVFSGFARSVIHNSNYQSPEEAKTAIDRYFAERNQYFQEYPQKAGNTIWREERVACKFSESNICKDPQYR